MELQTISNCRHPVEQCCNCEIDLYESDCCYYIDGEYYCEDCIKHCHVMLD